MSKRVDFDSADGEVKSVLIRKAYEMVLLYWDENYDDSECGFDYKKFEKDLRGNDLCLDLVTFDGFMQESYRMLPNLIRRYAAHLYDVEFGD